MKGTSTPAELSDEQYAMKNAKAIRFVLTQVPQTIGEFFHSIGQSLFPKRTQDVALKQHASIVAEHLAQTLLWELDHRKFGEVDEATELKYISINLHELNKSMLKIPFSMDGSGPKEALTLVLIKFYLKGGFEKVNGHLARFGEVLSEHPSKEDGRVEAARNGLKWILDFYSSVVRSKTITESYQSNLISNREHRAGDYFVPGQFVVEIRAAVLPAVSRLWNSAAIEKVGDQHVKQIIQILQVILKGEGEERALTRSDNASRRVQVHKLKFALTNTNGLSALTESGIETSLAREALYRCNNHQANSREYANTRARYPSFPIPDDIAATAAGDSTQNTSGSSHGLQRQRSVEMTDAEDNESAQSTADTVEPSASASDVPISESDLSPNDDDGSGLLEDLPTTIRDQDLMAMVGNVMGQVALNNPNRFPAPRSAAVPSEDTKLPFTTVEDLDEQRTKLRDALINRCLEAVSYTHLTLPTIYSV